MAPEPDAPAAAYYSSPTDIARVGGLDHRFTDIDAHYLAVMNEDLAAYTNAAAYWRSVAAAVGTAEADLHAGAEELRRGWPESGTASSVFLQRAEQARASLAEWRDVASGNASILMALHGALTDTRSRMEALYAEYEAAAKAAKVEDNQSRWNPAELVRDVTDKVDGTRHADVKKEFTLRSRATIMDGLANMFSQAGPALQRGTVYRGPTQAHLFKPGTGDPELGPSQPGALSASVIVGPQPGAPAPGRPPASPAAGRPALPPPAGSPRPVSRPSPAVSGSAARPTPAGLAGLRGRFVGLASLDGSAPSSARSSSSTRPPTSSVPSQPGAARGRPGSPPGLPPSLNGRNSPARVSSGGSPPGGPPPGSRPIRPQLDGRGGGGPPDRRRAAPPRRRAGKPPSGPALPGRVGSRPPVVGPQPPPGYVRLGGAGVTGPDTPSALRGSRGTIQQPIAGRAGEVSVSAGPTLGGRQRKLAASAAERSSTAKRALGPGLGGRSPAPSSTPGQRPTTPPASPPPAVERPRPDGLLVDDELFVAEETAPAVVTPPVDKKQSAQPVPALGAAAEPKRPRKSAGA